MFVRKTTKILRDGPTLPVDTGLESEKRVENLNAAHSLKEAPSLSSLKVCLYDLINKYNIVN